MKSDLVVVSWWSNCLALRCIEHLVAGTEGRTIYVLQVGKSEAQKARFRRHLPPGVTELAYPADRPAEHCRVLEAVVGELLPGHEGLWFVDHDVFFLDPLEPWLRARDGDLGPSPCCLGYLTSGERRAITMPLVWLSPRRLPAGVPGFQPLPFEPLPASRRPDLHRFAAAERIPEKDTLVRAEEFLAARGLVYRHPLRSLPRHSHLGGLYLLAFERLPGALDRWMAGCLARFQSFYAGCPPAWLADEDPVLLDRLAAWQRTLVPAEVGRV
ncbi:MAG: hypothetical protein ACK2UY_09440 [Anaerolineae bacterium]